MGRYSIADIARLTGIKAHTIRIWEKRYGIFAPERTDTNIRWYSDATLKKILKVGVLNNNGLKISKIAELSDLEINKQVDELSHDLGNGFENQIETLLAATIDMNEKEFRSVFDVLMQEYDFETIVLNVFYPFFNRIGVLWQVGTINPAQEHFVSNLIRQKILVAIDALAVPTSNKTILLFLHENEMHELGLLFMNFLMRKHNCKTIYLGQCVPFKDLELVKRSHNVKAIITSFISPVDEVFYRGYINDLSALFINQPIFLTGSYIDTFLIDYPENISKLNPVTEYKIVLKSI